MSAKKERERADRMQDKTVEDTFPASDPPANSGITGPGHAGAEQHVRKPDPTGHPTSDRYKTETSWSNETDEQKAER